MKNNVLKRLGLLTLVLWMLPLFMIVSCDNVKHESETKLTSGDFIYDVVTIDDCEYLQTYWSYGGYMAHKGNCSNPIHQKDTVYVYGVQVKYGTRDTIFNMYPIDSAKVAIEYLKSNTKNK